MKKYFYSDGTNSFGPFTLEELKLENIQRDTLIWYQGMKEWAKAEAVSELAELFELVPPVIKRGTATAGQSSAARPVSPQSLPKSWLAESILVTLFCCMPFGIPAIVNAAKVESRFYAGDFEGATLASANAKKWTVLSFWLGLSCILLYILFYVLVIVVGVFSSWGIDTSFL